GDRRQPVHRRGLHPPDVRLGRARPEGQEALLGLKAAMEFIKPGTQFEFMKYRWYFIGLSLALLVLSGLSFIYPGPRLGTDFKGGTEVEIAFKQPVSGHELDAALKANGFHDADIVSVKDAANPNRFMIRVQQVTALSEQQKNEIKDRLCLVPEEG